MMPPDHLMQTIKRWFTGVLHREVIIVCCLSLALKQWKGQHGFYIRLSLLLFSLLDKGHEAKNFQKECLFILHKKMICLLEYKLHIGHKMNPQKIVINNTYVGVPGLLKSALDRTGGTVTVPLLSAVLECDLFFPPRAWTPIWVRVGDGELVVGGDVQGVGDQRLRKRRLESQVDCLITYLIRNRE